MKIKHHDVKIEPGKPFANCKLGREGCASVLTEIVASFEDGTVLAIDNQWGTGKTTFVKMWQQYLIDQGFRTVYFNAWENDFDSNALVAILAELKPLTNEGTKEIFKSVIHKGAVLAKNVAPGLVKMLTAGMIDLPGLQIALEDTAKGVTEIFEKQVEEHVNKKKTIEEFRAVLETFIKDKENQKPLIFFVDELDRCRPSYSVEVLEQLKHLFAVPGIVFVLSIDKGQLAHAVRGYYGSDQINADEYLRRFIDLEYSIPKPSVLRFSEYLFDYYSFKDFFGHHERLAIPEFNQDSKILTNMATELFERSNATLRQQEKVFGLARLALSTVSQRGQLYPYLFFYLVYLKVLHQQAYQQIQEGSLSLEELEVIFNNTGLKKGNSDIGVHRELILALLLRAYCKTHKPPRSGWILHSHAIAEDGAMANAQLMNRANNSVYAFWGLIEKRGDLAGLKLEYLLNKIDLLESLKFNNP